MHLKILLLTISLLLPHLIWGVDTSTLSSKEAKLVKKLGITNPETLSSESFKELLKEKLASEVDDLKKVAKDKLQGVVDEKIAPKMAAIKTDIENEKKELKKDSEKLQAAYIASTISLLAATLVAPQAVMVCKTKPSAIIYAGVAAVYVLQEMRNIKILKASQLAEIEVITDYGLDQTKSAKDNAKVMEEKVDRQVGYLIAYKNIIDHALTALRKKAKNAKMVSAGFLTASAVAAAEQLNFFSGAGACVAGASLKFAPPSEHSTFLSLFNFFHSQFMASALAEETTVRSDTKKVAVMASLKNNKSADWVGDLDKLGIVGGLAANVIAYMAGWQMSFVTSIISSGTARAITFGVQAALAFVAGKLFDDAAKDMEKRLARMDQLITDTQIMAKKGINAMVPSDTDAKNFQDMAAKLGVNTDKLITEMPLSDAKAYLQKIKAKIENLDDVGKALLKKYEEEIKDKLRGKDEELKEKASELKEDALAKKLDILLKAEQLKAELKIKEDKARAELLVKKAELELKEDKLKAALQTIKTELQLKEEKIKAQLVEKTIELKEKVSNLREGTLAKQMEIQIKTEQLKADLKIKEGKAKADLLVKKAELELKEDKLKIALQAIKGDLQLKEEIIKTELKEKEAELKDKLQEKLLEELVKKKEGTSFIPFFFDLFISEALALSPPTYFPLLRVSDPTCVEKQTCPSLVFPKINHSKNMNALSQYLGIYESYYSGIKGRTPRLENNASALLEKNKSYVESVRNGLFQTILTSAGKKNVTYNDYERSKISEETNKFLSFYSKLSPQDKLEMNAGLNPANGDINFLQNEGKKEERKPKDLLSAQERETLIQLISRLESSEVKAPRGGPDMNFVKKSEGSLEGADEQYNFGNTSIHPKSSNLFEIIHVRHLKFMNTYNPDLE